MADIKQITVGTTTYNVEPYTNYLPLSGGKMGGDIRMTEGTTSIIFRDTSQDGSKAWLSGIYANSSGDEVLGIVAKNTRTHIMLGNADPEARPAATALTPAIDIKNGNVGINKRIGTDGQADAGSYQLDVNGAVRASGNLNVTGQIKTWYPLYAYAYNGASEKGVNCAAIVWDKPGSHNTGVGAHNSEPNVIYFGPCAADGTWVADYKQIWKFQGTIYEDGTSLGDKYVPKTWMYVDDNWAEYIAPSGGGSECVAIGSGACADGANAIVIGVGALSNSDDTVAIGKEARTGDDYSVAIGAYTTVSNEAVGIGYGAIANSNAIAIGFDADATGDDAICIGHSSSGIEDSISIGYGTDASSYAIAMGYNAEASEEGVAIGDVAKAQEENAIAIGYNAKAKGISIGNGAESTSTAGVTIGRNLKANADAINIGYGNEKAATGAVIVGVSNTGSTQNAVSVGRSNHVTSGVGFGRSNKAYSSAVAMGISCYADYSSVAVGSTCICTGSYAASCVAIGSSATAAYTASVAIGKSVSSCGGSSVAIGCSCTADRGTNIAIGYDCKTGASGSVSIGRSCSAGTYNSVAVGTSCIATGGVAMGFSCSSTSDSYVAMGYNSKAASGTAIGHTTTACAGVAIGSSVTTYGIGVGQTVLSYGKYSVAIGMTCTAGSTSYPNTSTASYGAYAIAIGYNTSATGTGSKSYIRIGTTNNYYYMNGTTWTSGSDERDKTNIQPLHGGLSLIKNIQPILFQYNYRTAYSDSNSILDYDIEEHQKGTKADDDLVAGFSAQEVAKYFDSNYGDECFNHIVDVNREINDETGEQDFAYTLGDTRFIPFMFQAIKEQQDIIEEQNERINKLELQLAEILNKLNK